MRNEAANYGRRNLLDSIGPSVDLRGPKREIHSVRFGVFRAAGGYLNRDLDFLNWPDGTKGSLRLLQEEEKTDVGKSLPRL